MKTFHRSLGRTAIAFAALAAMPAYATNGTWAPTAAGTYTWTSPTSNWSGGVVPNAIADTATLNTALAGNETITLGSTNITLGKLALGTSSGTFTYTLSTGTFTLNNNGGGASITELSNTSNGDTISTSIILADTLSNTIASNSTLATNTLTISGGITGTQALTLAANNAGIIKVSGAINNTGTVTNSGSGTGSVTITTAFGANVTTVNQNSATSALNINASNSANTITYNIQSGTMTVSNGNSIGAKSTVNLSNTLGATLALGGTGETIGALTGGGSTGGNITHTGGITIAGTNINATYGGNISGAGDMSFSMTGTQTLNGNVTISGGNTAAIVYSGLLQIGGAFGTSASQSYYLQIAGSGRSNSGTLGSGSVIIAAGGSFYSANQSILYTTGTFTDNGYFVEGQSSPLGAGTLLIGSTGTYGTTQGIYVTTSSTLTENSGGVIGATGYLSGLTIDNGVATLNSAANIYTSATTVNSGTLSIGANAPSGAAGALGNATSAVVLGSATATLTSANIANSGITSTVTGVAAILTNTGGITIGRSITETASAVNSSLVIGGSQTNGTSTYTGAITLADPNTTLASAAGGAVNFNNAIGGAYNITIGGGGLVMLTGTNTFGGSTNTITLQSGTLTSLNAGSNLGAISNVLAFNGGSFQFGTGAGFDLSARTLGFLSGGGTIDTNGNTVTFANAIGNGGTGSYTGGLTVSDSTGTGTLILAATNSYSGGTTVAKGTLETTGLGTLGGANGALTMATGGNLDLHGTSQNVGNLSGTGGLIYNNGSGTSTLTIGNGNAGGGTYSSVLEDNTGSGGKMALTKTGTGTIALTGSNTYTGATTVNGGSLSITGLASLGATAVTVNNAGTLLVGTSGNTNGVTIGNLNGGSLTLNTGGALTFTSGIVGSGDTSIKNLTLNGSGGTGLTIAGGTLNIGLGGSTADQIILGSGLGTSLSGTVTINLNVLSTLSTGSIELIAYGSGGTNSNSASYSIVDAGGASTAGDSFSIVSTSSGLFLDVSATSFAYWKGAGTSWSTLSNFTTDSAGTTPRTAALDPQTTVVFTATGGSNYANTTLNANIGINNLVINVAGVGIGSGSGSNTLTIAGSTGIALGSGVGSGTDTITANVVLGGSQTWTVSNAASTLVVSGNVSGSANLVTAGSGTIVLSGINTYNGSTTISSGYLNAQSSDAFDNTTGVTITQGGNGALQMSGGITLAPNLTINGSGPGGAGALESTTDANFFNGAISLGSASSIGSDTGLFSLTGSTINNNGYTLTLVGAGNGYISDVISGSGGLTMSGTGTWSIDNTNNYSGTTTINSGVLQLGTSSLFDLNTPTLGNGSSTLAMNGGTLDLNAWTGTFSNLTGSSGTITNSQSAGPGSLVLSSATGSSFGGSIVDGAGQVMLTKQGSGTQTLTGSNSYSGATSITGGALNIAGANALSVNSAVTVSSGAAMQLSGNITTTAASLSLAGTGPGTSGALENVSGNNTYTGSVSLAGNASIGADASSTLTLSTGGLGMNANNLALVGAGAGTISDTITGSGNLTMSGTGTWTLSGSNAYTGTTSVTAGTLVYTKGSAIKNSAAINLGGTGSTTLNYAGAGTTMTTPMNFSGTGTITLGNIGTGAVVYSGATSFSGSNITLDLGNATDTLGGSIGGIANATGFTTSVVKQGAMNSTWILTGSNTYTGNTTINGGVLQVASASAIPTGNLNINGSTLSPAILQTSGTLTMNLGNAAGQLQWGSNAGFSAIGGNLTLNITSSGTLVTLAWGSNFTGNGGALIDFGSSTANALTILTNNISLNTGDAFQQGVYVAKGAGGDATVFQGYLTNGTGTTAASGLEKFGAGTLILTNSNSSYSGVTSIIGGTLVAEANSTVTSTNSTATTTGVFGSGYGVVGNASQTAANAIIYLGNGVGSGSAGTGGVINPTLLVGSTTVGGSTTIANQVNVDWNNGTGQVYGIGGYTDSNNTFSGLINLSGTVATGNTFAITQVATTGSDALNITGGITAAGAGGNVNFANVGAVNVSTNGITNGTGSLSVTQTGSGTTTFSAANTYTGATTVSGGLLRINGSLTASPVTVNSGGALGGTGTISGAVTLNAGGTINFADGTIGTLTVGSLSIGSGSSAMTFDVGAGATNNLDSIMDLGAISSGGTTAITIGFVSGSPTLTAGTYTLISANVSSVFSDFSLTDSTLGNYAFKLINGGASGLELQVTSNIAPATYFYTGTVSTDFTDYRNFNTDASSGTQQTVAITATSDLTIGTTSPTPANLTPVANSNMSIDSLTFASSGSGATLSGTGTVMIAATGNGGVGIADNTSNSTGTETISTALVLGNSQSWSATSGSTLRVSGSISGSNSLALTGAGTYRLSGSNTFAGLTVGTGSDTPTLYIANGTNGSATGTGTFAVKAGATIGGKGTSAGTSFNIAGTGTATSARANVLAGMTSLSDTTTTGALTLTGSTGTSTIADANLTFNLDAKSTASTQINVGTTNVAFGTDSVGSVKLTLNVQNEPATIANNSMYTLIAGTGVTSTLAGSSTGQYTGLTLGTTTTAGGVTQTIITGTNLQLAFGNQIDQSYYGNGSYLVLYQSAGVDDIDVVVVPEPGTWAMMLGGLAALVFWQRRRSKA